FQRPGVPRPAPVVVGAAGGAEGAALDEAHGVKRRPAVGRLGQLVNGGDAGGLQPTGGARPFHEAGAGPGGGRGGRLWRLLGPGGTGGRGPAGLGPARPGRAAGSACPAPAALPRRESSTAPPRRVRRPPPAAAGSCFPAAGPVEVGEASCPGARRGDPSWPAP